VTALHCFNFFSCVLPCSCTSICPSKSWHEQRNVTLANTSAEHQIAIFEVTSSYGHNMVRSIKVENRPPIKKKVIHYIKPKKSSGYDEITCGIIKACASLISHPLSHIYSHSLYTGMSPDHLKITVVKQIHKKGDKTSMTNYRPISLLTVSSKVLEKGMQSRSSQHLLTNNILVTEQYSL